MSPLDLTIDERTASQPSPAHKRSDASRPTPGDRFVSLIGSLQPPAEPARAPGHAPASDTPSWGDVSSAERRAETLTQQREAREDARAREQARRDDEAVRAALRQPAIAAAPPAPVSLTLHADNRGSVERPAATDESRRGDRSTRRDRARSTQRPTRRRGINARGETRHEPAARRARPGSNDPRATATGAREHAAASGDPSDPRGAASGTTAARAAAGALETGPTRNMRAPGVHRVGTTSEPATGTQTATPAIAALEPAQGHHDSANTAHANTAQTNSPPPNHAHEPSNDTARTSSSSRSSAPSPYASSSSSSTSTRTSNGSGPGVGPGSNTPPGSARPQSLPGAEALRTIADASAPSPSAAAAKLDVGAATSSTAGVPQPIGVTPTSAALGSDAAARTAAIDQLRARLTQETARVRSFDGTVNLHFSTPELGDFEMKVHRGERGWEVMLRAKEVLAEQLLKTEQAKLAASLRTIDERISLDLGDAHTGNEPGSSDPRQQSTVHVPAPRTAPHRPATTAESSSPRRRATRVPSPDSMVDELA